MGEEKGFDDSRGELFFEIVRILRHHQPKALLLENVANVVTHDDGRTLDVILQQLRAAGCDLSRPSPSSAATLRRCAWLTIPNR
jgi:DNA (cytosine-5)-methyltransferase 1